MATEISDYTSVRQRAAELGCTAPTRIAILPLNFDTAKNRADLQQLSEAATVKTLFRTNNIPLDDLLSSSERVPYKQNKSFEGWLAPTLFISSSLLIDNQAIVSVALNVLSNYLTDFFKGMTGRKTVKLDIVVENNGDASCKKISYEGDIEGLKSLADVLRKL